MKIIISTTTVCLIAIALCVAPMSYIAVFGQSQQQQQPQQQYSSYMPNVKTVATSEHDDSNNSNDNSTNDNNDGQGMTADDFAHADTITEATDPFPPQGEVARNQPTPSQYNTDSSITMQEYYSLLSALRENGYMFNDNSVLYSHVYSDGSRDIVVVEGVQGDTQQPVSHLLEEIGKAWGYQMILSEYNSDGQLMTIYVGAF